VFRRVADIPGFQGSYADHLLPGIVVMAALTSGAWNGLSLITDHERGTLDRFLITPLRRGALIVGRIGYVVVTVTIQSLIIIAVGHLGLDARYAGGAGAILVLLVPSVLLACAFAGLSIALSLLMRRQESLISAAQFLVLPLTFVSTALMPGELLPGWIRTLASYNPVTWAAEAGRGALGGDVDWWLLSTRNGWLIALTALSILWAMSAFRSYQRSI
jgi:ABC-2 type transport system permease protein